MVDIRNMLKALLVLSFCGGFLAQMWQEFTKFAQNLKTVAISFQEMDKMRFPTFAFCDRKEFFTRVRFPGTAENYRINALDISDEISLLGVGKTDYHYNESVTHSYKTIPTNYNEFCKVRTVCQTLYHNKK
jgi:hypothetical protein